MKHLKNSIINDVIEMKFRKNALVEKDSINMRAYHVRIQQT